jgi:cellulose synthase/poly-beta-1,6-N-acetylglucosamine synthase-like glycosyltransferase
LAGIHPPKGWDVTTVVVENHTHEAEDIAVRHGARYELLATGNASIARNHGFHLFPGADVVAFLDDDAVPQQDWLERLAAPILAGDADATVGRCVVKFDGDVPDFVRPYYVDTDVALDPDAPFLIGMNMAVRPDAFRAVGGFPENLGPGAPLGGEDLLLSSMMRKAGYHLQAVLAAEVRHDIPAHRVTREVLLRRMKWAGRGEGWIAHHWFSSTPRLLPLRLLRSQLLLLGRHPLDRELVLSLRYWRERQMLAERLKRA